MRVARPTVVKSALVFAAFFAVACAGPARHPSEAPTPVAATGSASAPRSNLPPLVLPADSGVASPVAQIADVTVTVLPTIIGRRTTASSSGARPAAGVTRGDNTQSVRIAIALGRKSARVSASGDWSIYDGSSGKRLASLHATDGITVEARDGMLTSTDVGVAATRGTLIARPAGPESLIAFDGHRYRGDVALVVSSDAISVINRVDIESYLRGVVPLEIGTDRTLGESAAVEAQAIAARSYTYTRLDDSRPYDMVATTLDQVYGGVDAERPLSDAAVGATRNMVMMYDGKVINAPYHSNSGGVTAAASEVWRSGDEPYLTSVSDRIPGTDHYYGEDSPRFRWTRTLDASALAGLLNRYLPQYSSAVRGRVGTLRKITETGRTGSGRIAGLTFETDRGSYSVRGNDVRFILRSPGGDILPSTLFSFDQKTDSDGRVSQLVIRGAGNGHGVGMDQWGAIARARAGQDALTILHTYYPGTTIGRVI